MAGMHRLLIALLLFIGIHAVSAQDDAPDNAQDDAIETETTAEPPAIEVTGLDYGVAVSGRLDDATPEAIYAFDGLRGEIVTIVLETTGGNLDPIMTVLDQAGVPIALRDDSSSTRDVRLESLRIPKSDRFIIVVSRFGYGLGTTTGNYKLSISRIGVSSASGSALRYGDTVINQITGMSPQIYYSFRAERGDILNVSMQRISGNLDPYLQIVNSSAFVIADNDDLPESGSLDAAVQGLVIEQDGTYVIIASRFGQAAGDSTGGFYLTLNEAAESGLGNTASAPLPALEGIPMEGEITNDRYVQFYQFEARANDLISVTMERIDGSVDSLLSIIDSAGNELASNDDSEDSQNSAIDNFRAPADGTYYVVATRFQRELGVTTGHYRLTFQRIGNVVQNVPENIRFIPYGSTITGSVDDSTPESLYAFFGEAGDTVTVALSRGDGDLDPVVSILDTARNVLATNDDSDGGQNARIDRFTLPATGVYYIQATRYTGPGRPLTRGSYILVLAQRVD